MSKALEPWQQRVVEERAQLADRLDKLGVALNSPKVKAMDPRDRKLLFEQDLAMDTYLKVLDKRIARFNHGS